MDKNRIEAADDFDVGGSDRTAALTQHIPTHPVLRVREDLKQCEVQVGFTKRLISDPTEDAEEAVRNFAENSLNNLPRPRSHQRAGNLLVGGLMDEFLG